MQRKRPNGFLTFSSFSEYSSHFRHELVIFLADLLRENSARLSIGRNHR